MRKFLVLPVAALSVLAACSETPITSSDGPGALTEIVITPGIQAPARQLRPGTVYFSTLKDARPSVGGSTTTPISLKGASCTEHPAQVIIITYTLNGSQSNVASFKVNGTWSFNGSTFVGTNPMQVDVPPRSGTPTTFDIPIAVVNPNGLGSGTTSFKVVPFDLVTTGSQPGQRLSLDESSSATIHVAFEDCDPEPPANTPPNITIPADMEDVEATSSAGAAVIFSVPATDAEDGDLTDAVVCRVDGNVVKSGDTFPLGEHTVNCSVTDNGGLSAEGSFKITVVDTTPPEFTDFPGNQELIAANINGAVLDFKSLVIAAEDWNRVSEPANIECDYTDGTWHAIGSTTTVSCTATDARNNKSLPRTFDIFVTLDLSSIKGFEEPLRMAAPFSAHKAGSTIPHKFAAPRYADGKPATDIANGLRLTLTKQGGGEEYQQITFEDYGAGSTAWRYSPSHYIFNLKTEKNWGGGNWTTTVSYAGIPLASTTFTLR